MGPGSPPSLLDHCGRRHLEFQWDENWHGQAFDSALDPEVLVPAQVLAPARSHIYTASMVSDIVLAALCVILPGQWCPECLYICAISLQSRAIATFGSEAIALHSLSLCVRGVPQDSIEAGSLLSVFDIPHKTARRLVDEIEEKETLPLGSSRIQNHYFD